MQERIHVGRKLKKTGWIIVGLCFVLLYSCPVKKFLILQFDKSAKPVTSTSHFINRGATNSIKIEFLRRNDNTYKILSAQDKLPASFIPLLPQLDLLLAVLMEMAGTFLLFAGFRSVRMVPVTFSSSLLYLRWLRLRI